MVALEEYKINEEALINLQDEEKVKEHFIKGRSLQEVFDFSNEVVVQFYEAAKNVLEKKRYDEAVDAFVFMTTLNSNIPEFWLGLAIAQQNRKEFDAALYSYSIAFNLDGSQITPYILAAQCCMENKDFKQALEILDIAEKYAKAHPEEKTSQTLREDAVAAKEYIQQKRGD